MKTYTDSYYGHEAAYKRARATWEYRNLYKLPNESGDGFVYVHLPSTKPMPKDTIGGWFHSPTGNSSGYCPVEEMREKGWECTKH